MTTSILGRETLCDLFILKSRTPSPNLLLRPRIRDAALSAMALSCRKAFTIWEPVLLSDVTIHLKTLIKFYLCLLKNQSYGKLVQSITFLNKDELTDEEIDEIGMDSQVARSQGFDLGEGGLDIEYIVEEVYQRLPCIQVLNVLYPTYRPPFHFKSLHQKLAPLPFLTTSLRKLTIAVWTDDKLNLHARNLLWILIWCRSLREASLGCII